MIGGFKRKACQSMNRAATHPTEVLLHEQLLGPRLYLFAWIRFAVAAIIVAGTVVGHELVGVKDLPIEGLFGLAAAIAIYNIPVFFHARSFAKPDVRQVVGHRRRVMAGVCILLDFGALTVLVALLGGSGSPFFAFYIFHAIIAALLLSRNVAIVYCLFGLALYTGLVIGETQGWLPVVYPEGLTFGRPPVDGRYALTVWFCQTSLLGLTTLLATSIVAQLRRGESSLRRLKDQYDQLSQRRLDFIDVTFHDLKSPVTATLSHLNNMEAGLAGDLTPQQYQLVERCRKRLEALLRLLRDLLTLAHAETPEITQHMILVNPARLLQQVVEDCRDLVETAGQHIDIHVHPEMPRVRCVYRLVHEAVKNYLTNASKYSPNGARITLRAFPQHDAIRVEVDDEGPGIPPKYQHLVFDAFSRLHQNLARPIRGGSTGLGLSLVRKIITAHGGHVGFTSREGAGSTFWLTLPCPGARPASDPPSGPARTNLKPVDLKHA